LSVIFIFLDGVGIGAATAANPFYVTRTPYLPFYQGAPHLPDGTPVKAIDPLLGVAGLPQSGSGQTTLYTGENIPRLLNEHKSSFPTRAMRQIILEKNLLGLLKAKGLDAVFLNAYPMHSHLFSRQYLDIKPNGELHFSEEFPALFRRRISTTSCMITAVNQIPFDVQHIRAEESLFQDYTNQYLLEKGLDVPRFSPEKAAEILYNASLKRNFLLYEYFQTDLYAHRRSFDDQLQLIRDLNHLLEKLFSLMNPLTDTFILTSDHGNLEDSETRSHTLNPVPLTTWGAHAAQLRNDIHNLADVTPALVKCFGNKIV